MMTAPCTPSWIRRLTIILSLRIALYAFCGWETGRSFSMCLPAKGGYDRNTMEVYPSLDAWWTDKTTTGLKLACDLPQTRNCRYGFAQSLAL